MEELNKDKNEKRPTGVLWDVRVFYLPIYDGIDQHLLFRACFPEIDAGSFYIFMPHQVGKERNIITSFQKAFGETMPKGMGIDNVGIDAVTEGKFFQLA